MEALFIIMHYCLVQVKTSDTTCLYLEVANQGCINFVSSKDNYGSIMTNRYRIQVYKCLLERLEVGGSIIHVHMLNLRNLLPSLFYVTHCTLQNL
jgi:hypothetical protein